MARTSRTSSAPNGRDQTADAAARSKAAPSCESPTARAFNNA